MEKAINYRESKDRRHFIGGSDARIIMGDDETALLRLWREKRGEAEPEDLSASLIVQLGLVTEENGFGSSAIQARSLRRSSGVRIIL
jgi:predicted phage-related endonuclease